MKRLMVISGLCLLLIALVSFGLLLATTSTPAQRHTYTECVIAWEHIEGNELGISLAEKSELVQLILNNVWPPDSHGALLQECILDGWDDWRRY